MAVSDAESDHQTIDYDMDIPSVEEGPTGHGHTQETGVQNTIVRFPSQ